MRKLVLGIIGCVLFALSCSKSNREGLGPLYHFSGLYQDKETQLQYIDGTLCIQEALASQDGYSRMKQRIITGMHIPDEYADRLVLLSLSFVGEHACPPDQQKPTVNPE